MLIMRAENITGLSRAICPMMSGRFGPVPQNTGGVLPATRPGTFAADVIAVECLGLSCAWWSKHAECCCVTFLSELDYVVENLSLMTSASPPSAESQAAVEKADSDFRAELLRVLRALGQVLMVKRM